jgi:hypothetical protein
MGSRFSVRWTAARSACVVAFSPCPHKGSIRRHEPREHRRDEFRRLDLLSVLSREDLGVSDEVAMHGGRQLDGELDRPIVRNGGKFQLSHRNRCQFL